MVMESKRVRRAAAQGLQGARLPAVTGREEFEAQFNRLRVREKEHTHQGDEIAAERRRLPMVEVDASTKLIGANGPVTLLDTSGRAARLVNRVSSFAKMMMSGPLWCYHSDHCGVSMA
jgi:predicted dithiol-disulfide oxidoreductase (DUF899 family)